MKDIIKELRRSAMEDADPWCEIYPWEGANKAFLACTDWVDVNQETIGGMEYDDCRTFFLLVAEALERP